MNNLLWTIKEVFVEYEKNPLGMDVKQPRLSWKFESKINGMKQSAYQIYVGTTQGAADIWDSSKVESDCSVGVLYEGKPLQSCTRYFINVKVWDQGLQMGEYSKGWFETGLLDPTMDAWDGARWIGAPEFYVSADTRGVYSIESGMTIEEGGKSGGIVFGANDKRLLDASKNDYQLAGENYIRYELNVEQIPALLSIYRVGYHKNDRRDVPFAKIPVVNYQGDDKKPVITEENKYEQHMLRVDVVGNCAYTYVDDVLVDAEERKGFFGKSTEARQLNPRSYNDTITYPRLNEIGYFASEGSKVSFTGLTVRNLRKPSAVVVAMDTDKGILIDGSKHEVQIVKDPSKHSLPMLRRNFNISDKKIANARLYATARGIYECMINGKEISDQFFAPGCTQFDKHLIYQTYDISELLKTGENGIGFTLASGWWSDAQTFALPNYNYYGDKEALLAKIVITYEDGSKNTYVTNTGEWTYFGEGPYTYAGFFQGEHFDARRKSIYMDYSKPEFVIEGMQKPIVVTPVPIDAFSTMPPGFGRPWPAVNITEPEIIGSFQAPIKAYTKLTAKSMSEPMEGVYIYDLEQEIAGVPKIRLKGKAGTRVTIRYGEMRYPNLEEYGNMGGMLLTENLRDAESTDIYIMSGDKEGEIYSSKFTFHGFRYIEISGVEEAPKLEEVEAIQISSVEKITGAVNCSDSVVNRFVENVKWSQLCNFISIPTDCPQRNERMGWAGDTHVFARSATYQSDTRLFYYRYLQAFKDLQVNGQYPNIAPIGGGFGGITYECAMLFIAWELYLQYGDIRVIEENFVSMVAWMDFVKQQGMPGLAFVGPLADWLAPEETDKHLLWNAFYGYSAEIMAKMAAVIGNSEKAEQFRELNKQIVSYWNETFVDEGTGKTCNAQGEINDTQCSYALPLAYHMFDEAHKEAAYQHLARKTQEVGYTVSTGFFGTGPLCPMLSEGGYDEIAFKLIAQKSYPSWLYSVTQGATTIWERWNSFTVEKGFGGNNAMNSFNHYSLGSVISWMYETMLGIKRDEMAPGYKRFTLKPLMMGFEYAKGQFESPYGMIKSRWEIAGNGYTYYCEIPANATAVVELPGMEKQVIGSGSYEFNGVLSLEVQ